MHELKKQSTKIAFWPSPQDYNEAIQNPHANFLEAELRASHVHTDKLGLPRPMTGAFASVYRMSAPGHDVAVRCFLRNIADQEERYNLISDFVLNDDLPYTVSFEFMRDGIRVNSHWYPILKMEYVDGIPLDAFVREHGKDRQLMAQLAGAFVKMVDELGRAGIAHGDLQHGNILVVGDELRLVDYDGMFVPGMQGMLSNEIGHPNYQHPLRSAKDFGPNLDNFSAWVIYASLKSLSLDPLLLRALAVGDDCLLFRRDDFVYPEYSHAFALLEANPNPEVAQLARCVRWQLNQAPSAVAPLTPQVPEVGMLPKVQPVAKEKRPYRKVQSVASSAVPEWIDNVGTDSINIPSRRKSAKKPPPPTVQAPQPQQPSPTPNAKPIKPMPAALLRSGPRQVKWVDRDFIHPYMSQFLMLLNPLVWIMCVFMFVALPSDSQLAKTGFERQATVDEVRPVHTSKRNYWVLHYHYVVGRDEYTGQTDVNYDNFYKVGEKIPVRADVAYPAKHVVGVDGHDTQRAADAQASFDCMMIMMLALANLGLEAKALYKPWKHRGLVKNGKAVRGRVTKQTTRKGEKNSLIYYIEYEFTANGYHVTKRVDHMSKWRWQRYAENQTVIVVYDPVNPENAILYEEALYEAI